MTKDTDYTFWDQLKPRCPRCKSNKIDNLKIYKQQYVDIDNNNNWKLIEMIQHKCNGCKLIFWKKGRYIK